MSIEQWHLWIEGRVQGVGYRAGTESVARRASLTGFVSNLPDGRVKVVAEGPEADLQSLVEWCWQGPPSANVTHVSREKHPAQGGFEDFGIR